MLPTDHYETCSYLAPEQLGSAAKDVPCADCREPPHSDRPRARARALALAGRVVVLATSASPTRQRGRHVPFWSPGAFPRRLGPCTAAATGRTLRLPTPCRYASDEARSGCLAKWRSRRRNGRRLRR